MPVELSTAQVRRAALHCQLLDGRSRLGRGGNALARLIDHLGYIQIDTISVVERAHHHTCWVRLPSYRAGGLERLLESRRVFEYWGHAASYLPTSDYRFYLPAMRRHRERPHAWVAEQRRRHGHILGDVLSRIRNEGPLTAQDFETPDGARGPWWGWKPAKAALELLFWQGDLMIAGRRGFQRVYDLTERVLPPDVDTTVPTDAELARFLVTRALNAYGVAREYDIRGHIKADQQLVAGGISEMLADGTVLELKVEGEKLPYYALADRIDALASLRAVRPRLHLLSPFDNLVIQRNRLRRLFSFDYTIECYTPPGKRVYGYFSLPILWGARFAGRLDAKAERVDGVLSVRGLWLEDGFSPDDPFIDALAAKLREFAAFNGCDSLRIACRKPARLVAELKTLNA